MKWMWRERWHLIALVVALLPIVGRLAHRPAEEDPWRTEQRQVARQLQQTTGGIPPEAMKAKLLAHPSLVWRMVILTWGGVLVLVFGSVLLWRTVRGLRRGAPIFPGTSPPPAATWGLWDSVKVFVWLLCVAQALAIAQSALHLGRWPGWDRHLAATVNTLALDLMAIGLVGLLILRRARRPLREFLGMDAASLGRLVAMGLRGYLLWAPILVGVIVAVIQIVQWLHIEPTPQMVVVMLLQESRPRLLFALMGLVAVVGPIAEEILFRGVTYGALRRRWGVGWAVVSSAALFAALHADPIAFVPIFALGLLLAGLYERTGSLIPSMTVHIVHNSVMLVVAITVRDLLRVTGTVP